MLQEKETSSFFHKKEKEKERERGREKEKKKASTEEAVPPKENQGALIMMKIIWKPV